jgi:hypothetical protein
MRRSVADGGRDVFVTWPMIAPPNPDMTVRPGNVPTFGIVEDGYGNSGMTRTSINVDGRGRVIVHPGTFTLSWNSGDVTTEFYEIQWDNGNGEWETIGTRKVHQGPNTLTAQPNDPLNRPNNWITADVGKVGLDPTVKIYAQADDPDALYSFRIRGVNAAGEGEWSDVYIVNGPVVNLNGDAGAKTSQQAKYTVSVENIKKLATATLWFEVEDKFFAGKEYQGLNGFSMIGDVSWTQAGDKWLGRATVGSFEGGVDFEEARDIFEMTYTAKEEVGSTAVKLVKIELSGYDDADEAVYIDAMINNKIVDTDVGQYYDPCDINRDKSIDQLDLTAAQLYYAAKAEDETGWDEAKLADINEDGRVDIEDLILILNKIVW